jgi:hypothetical protein
MTPTNNTPPKETQPQQPTEEGLDDAICSAFRAVKRDAGHWDIWTDAGRDYIIRGEPGHVTAEYHGRPEMLVVKFKTVAAAMCWITDRLMSEPNA